MLRGNAQSPSFYSLEISVVRMHGKDLPHPGVWAEPPRGQFQSSHRYEDTLSPPIRRHNSALEKMER